MADNDTEILRELTRKYLEICHAEKQNELRNLWRQHNSLKKTRPLIYVRAYAWREMPQSKLECEAPLFRSQD